MQRREGSILILATVLALVVGGLTLAVFQTCFAYHRSSSEALESEFATRACESAVSYYLAQIASDPQYFDNVTTPTEPMHLGDASFTLDSFEGDGYSGEWKLAVTGTYGRVSTSMGAVIGYRRVTIPGGIVIGGTGDPTDVVFDLAGGSSIASYDPTVAPFDINNPGENSGISVDGSVSLQGAAAVWGDLDMSGTITAGNNTVVTGTSTESVDLPPPEDIDDAVVAMLDTSRTSNDNGNLAAVFGSAWSPISGSQNYGDLRVSGGSYTVPAGTYRFRRFELSNGAQVTFDTSSGPSNIIYLGNGSGDNDLILESGSHLYVDPGATKNALTAVLATDADFTVKSNSSYGSAPNGYNTGTAAYSKVISLGGNSSSDKIQVQANSSAYGALYAMAHDVVLGGNSSWYGSAVVRTLSVRGSQSGPAVFAVDDTTSGMYISDPTNYEFLARWPMGSPEAQ